MFQHQDLDVISMSCLVQKMTKWQHVLNLILSTTGSNRHVDVSCWAQILQWVAMKITHKKILCIQIPVYVDV